MKKTNNKLVINYINNAIHITHKSRTLISYLSKVIKRDKIKNKKGADILINNLYESIFESFSDAYMIDNYWNDNYDYDRMDSMVLFIIRKTVYELLCIEVKTTKEDKIVDNIYKDIIKEEEKFD
jgi:hypothetical protein